MDSRLKFREYVSSLEDSASIAILHHTDADGICAGIIAKKSIEKVRGAGIEFHFHQQEGMVTVTQDTINQIRDRNIDILIIVDLAIDHDPSAVKELEKHAKILLVDHHQKTYDINSGNTFMIKAEDLNSVPSASYPASKMCYDLFSGLTDISGIAWIAALGIVGDGAQSVWHDFLEETGIERGRLEQAEELVFYAGSVRGADGLNECFDIIDNSRSIDDILGNKRLNAYKKRVIRELNKYLDTHKEKAEFHNSLIIYEIEPSHRIKSRLINILSRDHYPLKTIIVIQKEGTRAYVSARRQDCRLSMNDLLKSALEGIPDSQGGGHIPAAGGYLPTKYLEKFRQKVIDYCEKKDLQ